MTRNTCMTSLNNYCPDAIVCDKCKVNRVENPGHKYNAYALNREAANKGWDVIFEEAHICPECAKKG